MGDVQTGYFLLAYTTVVFIAAITGCGVELIVLRQTAAAAAHESWGEANSAFLKSLAIAMLVSTGVAILVYLFAEPLSSRLFDKPEFADSLRAISPSIVGLPAFLIISRSLQGWRRINLSVFILYVSAGLWFSIAILLLRPTSGAVASWYFSLSALLSVAVGLIMLASVAKPGPGTTSLKMILRSAWLVWIMVAVETLTKLAGQMFAGRYAAPAEVAQLVISQRVAMTSTIAITAATYGAAPVFAEFWRREDMKAIKSAAARTSRTALLLATPMLLPMLLFPKLVLGIFSQTAKEGAALLQIAAIGQFMMTAVGISSFLLTMCDHERSMRNAVLVSGAVAILAGWPLTKYYGTTGAALSSTAAIIAMNVVSSWYVKQHLGFQPFSLLFWKG